MFGQERRTRTAALTLVALGCMMAAAQAAAEPPDFASPGQHTVTLGVRTERPAVRHKVLRDFSAGCFKLADFTSSVPHVGFMNSEMPGGSPCGASNHQIALDFDDGLLRQIPSGSLKINNATLTYEEAPGMGCMLHIFAPKPCWSSGGNHPENKPNGCVEIKLPTVDWVNAPPPDLIPYSNSPLPTVRRIDPRTWDVTQPFDWQLDPRRRPFTPVGVPGAPTGVSIGPSGFGFLMAPAIHIDNLTGEDNTGCVSRVWNPSLRVTYTVSDDVNVTPRMPN